MVDQRHLVDESRTSSAHQVESVYPSTGTRKSVSASAVLSGNEHGAQILTLTTDLDVECNGAVPAGERLGVWTAKHRWRTRLRPRCRLPQSDPGVGAEPLGPRGGLRRAPQPVRGVERNSGTAACSASEASCQLVRVGSMATDPHLHRLRLHLRLRLRHQIESASTLDRASVHASSRGAVEPRHLVITVTQRGGHGAANQVAGGAEVESWRRVRPR